MEAYHTDNGVYKSQAFSKALQDNYQSIRFSGVGAKWQNGVAEGAIGLALHGCDLVSLLARSCAADPRHGRGRLIAAVV